MSQTIPPSELLEALLSETTPGSTLERFFENVPVPSFWLDNFLQGETLCSAKEKIERYANEVAF